MKTIKILAITSFLLGIIFIIIGSLGIGTKNFYYENDLEGIMVKSPVILPSVLAMIFGILVLVLRARGQKVGPVFILLALLGIVAGGLLFLPPRWSHTPDARRMVELYQISTIMDMYNNEEGKYPVIKVNDSAYLENESIGEYLNPMPRNNVKYEKILTLIFIKTMPYQGFSNSNNRDKYCIYARMENGREFFAASQKGTKMLDKEPTGLDDCY